LIELPSVGKIASKLLMEYGSITNASLEPGNAFRVFLGDEKTIGRSMWLQKCDPAAG